MKFFMITMLLILTARTASAGGIHVAVTGDDKNDGTAQKPFRTISAAALVARPGDTVFVHAGIYRERVTPPRGGESDAKRIVYESAPGEKAEIRGSEVIKNWVKVQDGVWKAVIPNSVFGRFNPYGDLIRGDWFEPMGRQHHTGAVYINGDWLSEAATLDDVLKPRGETRLWYGTVDSEKTTIWARFNGIDPDRNTVEINVRRTVFYPEKPGINYITVRGFTMRHAATPWAPPTAEQIGLIGTHWSKGWIIENNVISHSRCSGIALGKYGDEWDNTSANSAEGYVKTIERALANGWNKETIGHHIVRNNTISDCEQTGIVGSLGAVFSRITGNHIYRIWSRRLFTGAEMAGIKIHAAIDVLIRNNRIHDAGRGMWMDWMAQGTRISGNLLYNNTSEDLFVEVDHGPFLVDNNLFLSPQSLRDMSEGGAYVHNLMAGLIDCAPEPNRSTPYHGAHSTAIAGMSSVRGGDDRFCNNIFLRPAGPSGALPGEGKEPGWSAGFGLSVYDAREFRLQTGGNVYCNGARPYRGETDALTVPDIDLALAEEGDSVHLHLAPGTLSHKVKIVTTDRLGKARVSGLAYENPDGSPLTIDTDYFGKRRDPAHPTSGPFENPSGSSEGISLKVW